MKRTGMFIVVAATAFSCSQGQSTSNTNTKSTNGYEISGTIRGVKDGLALLSYVANQSVQVDSSDIKGGHFVFRGKFGQPQEVQVSFANDSYSGGITFFADNNDITVDADTSMLGLPSVKGSPLQSDYEAYKKMTAALDAKVAQLNETGRNLYISGALTEQIKDSLFKVNDQFESERAGLISKFIQQHPASAVGAWAIGKGLLFDPKPAVLEPLFNALDKKVQSGLYGKIISDALVAAKATSIGQPAMDFTQPDVNGKAVSLSSFKGKYVLIDFWASWCGPCRAENPNVVHSYNEYKSKGFEILGVSLDENKSDWLKAIAKDNLAWTQVSDLKGWSNAASQAYGIKGIPFNLLLDKNGVIVAKNLRGEALTKKLKELFN